MAPPCCRSDSARATTRSHSAQTRAGTARDSLMLTAPVASSLRSSAPAPRRNTKPVGPRRWWRAPPDCYIPNSPLCPRLQRTASRASHRLYHVTGSTVGIQVAESLSTVDNIELIYQSAWPVIHHAASHTRGRFHRSGKPQHQHGRRRRNCGEALHPAENHPALKRPQAISGALVATLTQRTRPRTGHISTKKSRKTGDVANTLSPLPLDWRGAVRTLFY